MTRIKALNRYQQAILLLLTAMFLIFTVIYASVTSKVGFAYKDRILRQYEEDGQTVYSGTIGNCPAVFTVTSNTVTFQYADTLYGPYTIREDPTAIPVDKASSLMTGYEILDGKTVLFRGGVIPTGDYFLMYHEDGSSANSIIITATGTNGVIYGEDGKPVDPLKPSISTILELYNGPELTHKGHWALWFFGVFTSAVTAISILFTDELFRFALSFRIHDAYSAEPSDWELMGRYIGWTILPIITLVAYIIGLQFI